MTNDTWLERVGNPIREAYHVNGLHLYSAFIQSAVQFRPLIHPFTHIHTHIHTPTAIGCHARYQPARQEQLSVRGLAQGHWHYQGGIEPATLRLPDDSTEMTQQFMYATNTKEQFKEQIIIMKAIKCCFKSRSNSSVWWRQTKSLQIYRISR